MLIVVKILENHNGCHSQCPSCKEDFDIINLGSHYETCIREKMKLIRGGRPRNQISSASKITTAVLVYFTNQFGLKALLLQGDTGGWRPGLGWLWLGCSIILPSRPTSSVQLPLAQAESGRQGNIKTQVNQSQVCDHQCHPLRGGLLLKTCQL